MSEKDLLRRAGHSTHARIDKLAKKLPKTIRPLLFQIRDHYCDTRYRIFQIQREAEVSDWQVKVFQREIGKTPGQLFRALRLETASILLRDISLTIERVSALVGYKSARALRKCLRALAGLTPTQVRRNLRLVVPEQRQLGEELFSWYFWVRHHRGELEADGYRAALAFLENRFGPPDKT